MNQPSIRSPEPVEGRFTRTIALWVLLLASAALSPAHAQDGFANQPAPFTASTDPVDRLSMFLRTLAAQPRNLTALLGAGQAALDVGDPNAAVGFFARAEAIESGNGRAKAGLGSALVMLERPEDALRLFGEASARGVPEADIARDRGLAYDLRGDSRLAQRDYALALRGNPDDETTRRYALSLGITGDRAGAMKLLDPLLRKKDQGAWRARAFIMAMTGDANGAESIARAVMPAGTSAAMAPFLTRLAGLNAAERAHAVNFGSVPPSSTPSNGQALASAQDPYRVPAPGDGLTPAGDGFASHPYEVASAEPLRRAPPTRALRHRPGEIAQTAAVAAPTSRVLPGFYGVVPVKPIVPATPAQVVTPQPSLTARVGERVGARLGPVDPAKLPTEARGGPVQGATVVAGPLPVPVQAAAAPIVVTPSPVLAAAVPAAQVSVPAPPPAVMVAAAPVQMALNTAPVRAPVVALAAPPTAPKSPPMPFEVPSTAPLTPAPAPQIATNTVGTVPPAARPVRDLAAIVADLTPEEESRPVALPTVAEQRALKRAAAKKAQESAAAAEAARVEKAAADAKLALARANPARLWVQVATGNNERGLPGTWKRIRDDNASALRGKNAWFSPFKATNRLLAGPMKSPTEARALVSALGKNGVSAMTFTSDQGQEITRLGGQ